MTARRTDNLVLVGPAHEHEDGTWAFVIIRGCEGNQVTAGSDLVCATDPELLSTARSALLFALERSDWGGTVLEFQRWEPMAQAAAMRWAKFQPLLDPWQGDAA